MLAIPQLHGYLVDERGRVWSEMPGRFDRWLGKRHEIQQWTDRSGYRHVTLRPLGGRKRYAVHRLVAAAFLGPCPDGCVCSHKNGDPADNRPDNLEYISQQENIHRKRTHGTMVCGELQYKAKLTTRQVMAIRQLCADGVPQISVAAKFKINKATVHSIKTGRTWKHLPLIVVPQPNGLPDEITARPARGRKPVPAFPGYQVDAAGNVYSVKSGHRNRWAPVQRLKPHLNRDGYLQLQLQKPSGKWGKATVHRLVALAWLGERPDGYVCHHRNGKRTDNRVANLAYVSSRANVLAKWKHGTMQRGESSQLSVLTTDQVREIHRLCLTKKHTDRSLAKRFGVVTSTIWSIKSGRSWKHVK